VNDYTSLFRSALADAHIPMGDERVLVDDTIHRYATGEDKEKNCWYVLHLLPARNGGAPIVVGAAGCWKRNMEFKWCSVEKSNLSKEDWAACAQAQRDLAAKRAEDEARLHKAAAEKCQHYFNTFPLAKEGDSLYLLAKGVPVPHGTLYVFTEDLYHGWLALPLQDIEGTIRSAQFIADDGTKKFCYGGEVKGCFYLLSDVPGGPVLICEGYATGASLFQATGWTVICAMNCGNLMPAAKAFRQKYPDRTIVLCADNDQFTQDNPGLTKAKEAAKAIKAQVCYPEFADEALADKPTDFNDLHENEGLTAVRRQVLASFPVVARPIGDFQLPPKDDPTELLKHRYLCERGSLLINGSTGMGKSSVLVQAAALWANELDFFGIYPRKPLKTVIIQAENDDGDIAQMRDGICRGLQFTQEQRRIFFENVLIYSSCGLSGRRFCQEIVRPLLDLHAPNLCAIDPAFAYVGGDVKEQKVVGPFLREFLNPVIFEHECACAIMHHTNKPIIGKEKGDWRNGDLAYTGSGSAEWANWARAVLSLQSTGTTGLYKLNAAKRGARLAWTASTDSDEIIYQKVIAWSQNKDMIYWRTPDQAELPDDVANQVAEKRGPKPKYTVENIVNALQWNGNPTCSYSELFDLTRKSCGISESSFKRILEEAKSEKAIFQSVINGKYQLLNKPQTVN